MPTTPGGTVDTTAKLNKRAQRLELRAEDNRTALTRARHAVARTFGCGADPVAVRATVDDALTHDPEAGPLSRAKLVAAVEYEAARQRARIFSKVLPLVDDLSAALTEATR